MKSSCNIFVVRITIVPNFTILYGRGWSPNIILPINTMFCKLPTTYDYNTTMTSWDGPVDWEFSSHHACFPLLHQSTSSTSNCTILRKIGFDTSNIGDRDGFKNFSYRGQHLKGIFPEKSVWRNVWSLDWHRPFCRYACLSLFQSQSSGYAGRLATSCNLLLLNYPQHLWTRTTHIIWIRSSWWELSIKISFHKLYW